MNKVLTFLAVAVFGLAAQAQSGRNVAEYNLKNSVGLKGFDPVAVFPEGGGAPLAGQAQFQLNHLGVTYLFANQVTMNLFVQNPGKYEPTYGGWCAYAMASGSKVDIQPHLYSLQGNRAHYFVSARAKQNFDRDVQDHVTRADAFWKQISGEDPRQ